MRVILNLVPSKRIDLVLGVLERRKPVHVQTLLAEPTTERLDRGVVGRVSPVTEVQAHAVGVRPRLGVPTGRGLASRSAEHRKRW